MNIKIHKSLSGRRVLVTRPSQQTATLAKRLRELGAIAIEFPTIEIVPAENTDQLDHAIRNLDRYEWVIFTSVHGVRFFLKRMVALGFNIETLRDVKVVAIGPATATAFERTGKKVDYTPDEYLSERILNGLGEVSGRRVLLPRADIASRKLPETLRARGALVDEVIAYRTIVPRGSTSERLKSILRGGVDLVTFTSPSTVRNLIQILGNDDSQGLLRNIKVICIGPVTAAAARELGIPVDTIAQEHTVDGLMETIVNEIGAT